MQHCCRQGHFQVNVHAVLGAQCQGCCLVQVVYTPSVCGNGILEAGEGCDDGDLDGGDGCSATCQVCLSVW